MCTHMLTKKSQLENTVVWLFTQEKYEHPIGILGAGMGGLMTALDFLRQDRKHWREDMGSP